MKCENGGVQVVLGPEPCGPWGSSNAVPIGGGNGHGGLVLLCWQMQHCSGYIDVAVTELSSLPLLFLWLPGHVVSVLSLFWML